MEFKFIAAKKKKKSRQITQIIILHGIFWDQVHNPMKKLNNLLANYVIHY